MSLNFTRLAFWPCTVVELVLDRCGKTWHNSFIMFMFRTRIGVFCHMIIPTLSGVFNIFPDKGNVGPEAL